MTKIMLGVGAAMMAAIVGLGVVIWFKDGKIEDLNKDVATEQANNVTLRGEIKFQNESIISLEVQRALDQDQIKRLQENFTTIQVKRDKAVANLNSWRTRLEEEGLKRPKVVARAARKAINQNMTLACKASGGCQDE